MTTSLVEYALMAGTAYRSTRDAINRFPIPTSSGWNEIIGSHRSVDDTGFEALSFTKGAEIVISYAGTEPSDITGDIAADLALAAGLLSDQLKQAADYYFQIKAAAPAGTTISFTGHSLGGGLASLMAVMFGESATTFDQAPFRQSALAFASTDYFGNPIANSAAQRLRSYLADHVSGEQLVKLDAYIASTDPNNSTPNVVDTLVARSTKVTNINTQGEFLSSWFLVPSSMRIGSQTDINNGNDGVSALDLHSQALLTAFLQSRQSAAEGHSLDNITFKLTDLLRMVFDKNLFAHDTDPSSNKVNLLEHLVRHQAGGVDGIPIGGDAMVTRFTADLDKLAADAGLSVSGANLTKALIAFAMQAYYSGPHASEADRQLFKKVAGGINFDRSDVAGNLAGIKGYTQYFQNHLASLPATERALIAQYLPALQDWYLAGTRLAATATDKSAFMLGAADTDLMIGGTQNDLLVGLGSTDLLEGGKGDDILVGGDGYDIYRYATGDGAILVNGGDAGGLFLRQGQSETWTNADNHLTLAHGATWKLTLADGGELDLGETLEDGDYGIRRLTLPTVPTTHATDTGSAFDDNDLDTDLDHQAVNASASGVLLQGLAGSDQINGSGGDDLLEGGSGADILAADNGNDWLYGNEAMSLTDALVAGRSGQGSGTRGDWLNGGKGDDSAMFSNSGGAANDTWWRVAA
ncbi:MAG: hypothetical protein OEL88_16935 [Sterolibacteriaceae bacterium MAG5]|nr:hypothetical protein [Candidatus Nitricoxidireducens bremensis]